MDEWTSILKIACAYDFPGVKDFAVRGLESCDIPIANRIRLYRTFDVDAHYIIPWFVRLCLREDGPTDGETEIMGTKVSLIIYRARERLRSMVSPAEPPLAISESAAVEVISSILGYNSPIAGPGSVSFHLEASAAYAEFICQLRRRVPISHLTRRRGNQATVNPPPLRNLSPETPPQRRISLEERSSREAYIMDNIIFNGHAEAFGTYAPGKVIQSKGRRFTPTDDHPH